jgi:hypothetical protein
LGAASFGLTTTALVACSPGAGREEATRQLRRPVSAHTGDRTLLLEELVRYATLAPSSHNTQCWKFRARENLITIEADFSRRCPVVDPDDHHMFVSLGCAAENLAQAALANGLRADPVFDPAGEGQIVVSLGSTKPLATQLYEAIPARQCTRGDYDGKPLSAEELRLLEQAGSGPGVRMLMLTERSIMEKVLEFVVAGNTAQMGDPAFVEELKAWIRFSEAEAVRTGDGLFAGASGNPSMPRWLGSRMMSLFFTTKSENERYARQIRNSAGIAVFVSESSDKAHWFEAGRCYERFALQATALGIRNAFLNQPVEVGAIRPGFAAAMGLGNLRPDLVVRFGRGPALPMSMRRPVHSVLV